MSAAAKPASDAMNEILGRNVTRNPQKSAEQSQEPPSGIQGVGTKDQPYDQGNQPEQSTAASNEPLSGVQGQGTKAEPYDMGNQTENAELNTTNSATATPTTANPTTAEPESRGRNNADSATTSTTTDPSRLAPKWPVNSRQQERSVSPGQLDDGTHVATSGDKGESYTAGGSTLSKIRSRFHVGHK